MNVGIITDLHFGFEKNSEIMLNNTLNFLRKQFIPYLIENNINQIFILGDLFDNRNSISTKVHNEVYKIFDEDFSTFKVYIILGNHDIYYNSSNEIHSLKFLSKFENVVLVETPIVIKLDKKILLCPWLVDQNEIGNIVDELDADILMGHFDITGFNFNKKVLSKNGMSTDSFKGKFKLIFSGHFHTRTVKNIKGTEFVYVGSPYQMNRGDSDEERGFIVLDLETEKYKFISNEMSPKFVEITYPEKITKEMVHNNRVDVYIQYKKEDYAPEEFNRYVSEIESFNPAIITLFYTKQNDSNVDFDVNTYTFSSIPDLFHKYMEANKIDRSMKELLDFKFTSIYDKLTK